MLAKTPCTIAIEGKILKHYVCLNIHQKINDHHTFEVILDNEVSIQKKGADVFSSKDYIGKSIYITIKNYDFLGRITGVEFEMRKGNYGYTHLKGYSKTILLESGKHMRSFTGRTISQIVKTILENAKMKVILNPQTKKLINYHCQYNESDFNYLQRIAKQYNEWFYYDGEYLVFGKPKSEEKVINLQYEQDIYQVTIKTNVEPVTQTGYDFKYSENSVISSKSKNDKAMSVISEYGLNASIDMYPNYNQALPDTLLDNKYDVDRYIEGKTESLLGKFDVLEAKSKHRGLQIGSIVSIFSEERHVGGRYMIIEITHTQSEETEYENTFKGIPAGSNYFPEPEVKPVFAGLQRAIVTDNQDKNNKGRVKVKMLWQYNEMESDWLQVLAPDAGKSSIVTKNRGYVFVPEIGDQVMVGFHYNDPNRPFILGSLHNSSNAAGGKQNNIIKSITTRSGHTIEFNDTANAESITIKDKKKNTVFIDTANNDIEITANETMTFNCKNMKINVAENMTTLVGKNSTESAGQNISISAGVNINQAAGANFVKKSTNMSEDVDENMQVTAKISQDIVGKLDLASTVDSLNFNSAKDISSNTKEKSNFQ